MSVKKKSHHCEERNNLLLTQYGLASFFADRILKNNTTMKVINYIILFFVFLSFSCNYENEQQESLQTTAVETQNVAALKNNADLEIKIFNNDTIKNDKKVSGFGYDIYRNGARYIHQPSIPAVEGNNGFDTEEKAKKAATFVAHKIELNIMPPSVTPEELDSLGVL